MGSGKSGGGQKDYYGHCAGVVCQGQLDFIWGILVNNDLVWPKASLWDSATYASGRQVIFTDGNVYQASQKTSIDPPVYPWILIAVAWSAGTYSKGSQVLRGGFVFKALSNTNTVPPSTATSSATWSYVSSPAVWSSGTSFWTANSIVAWKGRLWTTPTGTKAEPPNAPWVLWRVDRAVNPLKLTIDGMGDCYLYWGTANQVLDTTNEKTLSSLGHPPYRNKAVLFVKNFLFGTGQANPPDIQVLGGRNPVQSLITGAASLADADWQVNPWCMLAEALTHPVIGLGLPASLFNSASWQAEANRCAANPQLYYISPFFDSLKKVRELVSDLMSYPDAFVFWSNVGTLMAGHWPHGESTPAFNSFNTVNRDNMVDELSIDSGLWSQTVNSVGVSFDDVQSGFKTRPVFAPNLFNLAAIRRVQGQKIERNFITRESQALAWAAEYVKIAGDVSHKGEAQLQQEKTTISPGSIFLLTDDVMGFSVPSRCTKKVIAAAPEGKVTLSFETERGLKPQPYSPSGQIQSNRLLPSPSRVVSFQLLQLPAQFGESGSVFVLAGRTNDTTSQLDVWIKSTDISGFQLLGTQHAFAVPGVFDIGINSTETLSSTSSAQTTNLGAITAGNTYALPDKNFWKNILTYADNSSFTTNPHVAVEGIDYIADPIAQTVKILSTGAIATGKFVKIQTFNEVAFAYDLATPQSDLDSISESLTQDEIDSGEILLFAFQSNPLLFEIMSVRSLQSVGIGAKGNPTMFVKVVRAMYGTLIGGDGSYVWGTNPTDKIFIIKSDGITSLITPSFEGFQNNLSTMKFRLSPISAWVEADVTDVYDVANNPQGLTTEATYTWGNPYAPSVSWIQLLKNGTGITDFTGSFVHTDTFDFSFILSSLNQSLVHAALIAMQGQQEITLWATNMTPVNSISKEVIFQLGAGAWGIEMRTLDLAGNQSSIPLSVGGKIATMYIDGATATAPKMYPYPPPRLAPGQYYYTSQLFGLMPVGLTVHYQIQPRGTPYGAIWATCSQFGAANASNQCYYGDPRFGYLAAIKQQQTVYAYTSKTGLANSAVVSWNF